MALLHHGYTPLGQYVPEVLSPTSAEKTLHGHCYATHRIAVTQLAALKPPLPTAKQVLQRQSPSLLQQAPAPAAVHSVPAFAKSPPQQHT